MPLKENKKRKEPWRIIVAVISIIFIAFLWAKKDIVTIYSTMPQEQIIPMIVTTVVVSLLKVAIIALIVLLFKWIAKKVRKK